jgi:hypothetical protein
VPLEEIFCLIDDFCKYFERHSQFVEIGRARKKTRVPEMSLSEMMTIVVLFHMSGFKTFKHYYNSHILGHFRGCFPKAISYNRFIALMPRTFMPLLVLSQAVRGKRTGKYFVDSSKLQVCHNLRIWNHKVFKGLAQRGKTSTGWFFGFKLHLILNERGEIVQFCLSPGNVHDSKMVQKMAKGLEGWLFGDKGYLSQPLSDSLAKQGLSLFTKTRKNMKPKTLSSLQKFYLSKRSLIETVIDQLKAICSIDHSRHRSPQNFLVNFLSSLLAYTFKFKKPSLNLSNLIQN